MPNEKPAYLVGNFTVTNPVLMAEYGHKAAPLVQKYSGEILLSASELNTFEGTAQPMLVIIRFPDMEKANDFYHSSEYAPVKQLRTQATTGGFILLTQGLPTDI